MEVYVPVLSMLVSEQTSARPGRGKTQGVISDDPWCVVDISAATSTSTPPKMQVRRH